MKPVKFANVVRERARLGIQMHANELFFIARTIKAPMNFLVFGMGNDSPFWSSLNRRGRTVFIEDQRTGQAGDLQQAMPIAVVPRQP